MKKESINRGQRKSAYAGAGVDIDLMARGLGNVKRLIRSTVTEGVAGDIGSFGGLFAAPGKDHLLVASTDGVGTKLKVAAMTGRHRTIGIDLVNHCVNDILVQGAKPLFFLDYLGAAKLDAGVFADVVHGLCKACRDNNCALLGGETAEMPGLYPRGEYDLVGTIIGSVPRRKVITGDQVRPGDVIVGLASGGLQTNGYSLARKVIFRQAGLMADDCLPGTRQKVADLLLRPHRSFLRPVEAVMRSCPVRGMAHITGGGFPDNLPRVLPEGCRAAIDRNTWKVPAIFEFIRRTGKVSREEMYRVFNMGIGFVLIVREKDLSATLDALKRERAAARVIGRIEPGQRGLRYVDG